MQKALPMAYAAAESEALNGQSKKQIGLSGHCAGNGAVLRDPDAYGDGGSDAWYGHWNSAAASCHCCDPNWDPAVLYGLGRTAAWTRGDVLLSVQTPYPPLCTCYFVDTGAAVLVYVPPGTVENLSAVLSSDGLFRGICRPHMVSIFLSRVSFYAAAAAAACRRNGAQAFSLSVYHLSGVYVYRLAR